MITVAPIWYRRSTVSFTARSFPGIGVAEKMIVSPECSFTFGCSPWAMRRSADSGSPWLPVVSITSRSSGKLSISLGDTSSPSGTWAWPSWRAMFRFLRIERPTTATLRSSAIAASITCWSRCTLDANEVTTTRPGALPTTSCNTGPTLASDGAVPLRSAFVESPHSSSTPSRPSSARRAASVGGPSTGVWSNL